jgi:hypothetical protein
VTHWRNYIGWKIHIARTRWHAFTSGCAEPQWHPVMCRCDPRKPRPVSGIRRHPWVIMSYFSLVTGFWGMLWTGLEGWWLPFGILAFGFSLGLVGLALFMYETGGPPKFRDYLTLVKTITKLRV